MKTSKYYIYKGLKYQKGWLSDSFVFPKWQNNEEDDKDLEEAATLIQANFRGFLQRKTLPGETQPEVNKVYLDNFDFDSQTLIGRHGLTSGQGVIRPDLCQNAKCTTARTPVKIAFSTKKN